MCLPMLKMISDNRTNAFVNFMSDFALGSVSFLLLLNMVAMSAERVEVDGFFFEGARDVSSGIYPNSAFF